MCFATKEDGAQCNNEIFEDSKWCPLHTHYCRMSASMYKSHQIRVDSISYTYSISVARWISPDSKMELGQTSHLGLRKFVM